MQAESSWIPALLSNDMLLEDVASENDSSTVWLVAFNGRCRAGLGERDAGACVVLLVHMHLGDVSKSESSLQQLVF